MLAKDQKRTRALLAGVLFALFLLHDGGLAWAAPPTVVTVPWEGLLDLQHETYNGKQIHLKGIARDLVAGATASWNPGDGTPVKAATVNPSAAEPTVDYDLGVTHTYPNSADDTPFTATLTVCNPGNECASDTYRVVVRPRSLDVEINIAIDEGLWYLHRQQLRSPSPISDDGRFPWSTSYSRDGQTTASAVQAFQINNHFQTNPDNQDPYADTVRRGLRYMFTRLQTRTIGPTSDGNPDTNGNGIGADVVGGYYEPYQLGQIMDAIVSTKTPNAPVPTGPLSFLCKPGTGNPPCGQPYSFFDAVQDMVDTYAWGQYKAAANAGGGGWRYTWNEFPDNSACQWAAIGILAARDIWGATVPLWVTTNNLNWLSYSQTPAPPANATGYGYTGRGEGTALSPSGLIQAIMDGVEKTDVARWKGVEERMASQWNSWYRDSNDEYSLYALTKAMRLAIPSPIVIMGTGANAIDWFKADCANPAACNTSTDKWGVARTLIRDQNADGLFTGNYRVSGNYRSAWSIIMLTGVLQLEPVAVIHASPNPGANNVPVNFDGTRSYHRDPNKTIVNYEWDFDNDSITDAVGPNASYAFNCAVIPCNYLVRLTVTDNSTPTPLVDTADIVIRITNPPHPPTADANGPYLACVNENVTLDGRMSFDVDEPLGDSITAYGWELDSLPQGNFDFDEAFGMTAITTFATAGKRDIGLQVTDDSANVFGGPNLTDQDFTTTDVWNCCVNNLSARAKPGKISVTWTPVGGATGYDIYRSMEGANTGFVLVKANHVSSYAVYADFGLANGKTYWYRVVPKNAQGKVCDGSVAVSATPTARQ